MNKTIEAIKNGQAVSTEELFALVNLYELTHLNLTSDDHAILAMHVNKYESYRDIYEFSQDCSADNNKLVVKKNEVISSSVEWDEKADALFITCQIKNNLKLQMFILFPAESFKETESEEWYETDVYDLKEFLDDVLHENNEWHIIFVRATDMFGFDLKLSNPFRTYINTLGDDWKLHISDDFTSFEVPVTDDSGNLFFMKKTDSTREIIVKPYGQSFMEIKMLFFKKH